MNIGDKVIYDSALIALGPLLNEACVYECPTHTRCHSILQNLLFRKKLSAYRNVDYQFICGTNLLYVNMLRPLPNWNIDLLNTGVAKNAILLGVGLGKNATKANLYTRLLYKRTLSKSFIHSVRDEATKVFLEDMGFRALNTGCVTMWGLSQEHLAQVPTSKSDEVVFTLTHYTPDEARDREMIKILGRNYNKLYFWPQAFQDIAYLERLNATDEITIIPSNLISYQKLLQGQIDYVGNRLHGGVYAIQQKKRAVILSIDYRTVNMFGSNSPIVIPRHDIETLRYKINSTFSTSLPVHYEKIKLWLNQFGVTY